MLISIGYIELDFTFALPDNVLQNEEFALSRFCTIHVTVIFARRKNIFRYMDDFSKPKFVNPKFLCSTKYAIVLIN